MRSSSLGKKIIVYGLAFALAVSSFFGCKAQPVDIQEEVNNVNKVEEEYQEEIVEEIEPTLEDKIKEYNLENLMQEIQNNDLELYNYYTTGDVDNFLPILANISKYISNEKILEKRPTVDSLKELDNIVSEIKDENAKENYVNNAFKKRFALIITANADLSFVSSILPMWLCNKLNIHYALITNTNNKNQISYSTLESWKGFSGMWDDETRGYYNEIKEAIQKGGTDKIMVNFNAQQILDKIKYYNETLNVDEYELFITTHGDFLLKSQKICETLYGEYSTYTAQQFMDSIKPNNNISQYFILDNSCEDEFYDYVKENEKIKRVSSPGVIAGDDPYSALIIAKEINDSRIEPYELRNIAKTKEQLESEGIYNWLVGDTITDDKNNVVISPYKLNDKSFHIQNGGYADFEVTIKGIKDGESVLYYTVDSLNK